MRKGRSPCCDKSQVKKGPWSPAEDLRLITYIQKYGHGNWRALPKEAGLMRCGKSCRLRWINYLRPDVKRGKFTREEEDIVIRLHETLGNKWSRIASYLPGRTDNEIKNIWNTYLKKRVFLESKHKIKECEKSSTTSSCSSSSSSTITSYSNIIPLEENNLATKELNTAILNEPVNSFVSSQGGVILPPNSEEKKNNNDHDHDQGDGNQTLFSSVEVIEAPIDEAILQDMNKPTMIIPARSYDQIDNCLLENPFGIDHDDESWDILYECGLWSLNSDPPAPAIPEANHEIEKITDAKMEFAADHHDHDHGHHQADHQQSYKILLQYLEQELERDENMENIIDNANQEQENNINDFYHEIFKLTEDDPLMNCFDSPKRT